MSGELKAVLEERLHKNYEDFLAQLQGKSVSELIDMAPEITAAKQCRDELLDACDADDIAFLLRFDDPLEVVRGYWENEITGYDKSGEMGHMLWKIQDDFADSFEQQDKAPIAENEILIDPVMDFTGKEIIAYAEIGFDVGRRFQVYPDVDDTCDLYMKYDPVSQTLRGELCIKGYEDKEQWEPVEFMPSEKEMIIGLMEGICQKDMGKSLRDTWTAHHPAINRKNLQKKKNERCQHER